MADDNVLGIQTATTVAGFIGTIVSLSAIRPLTRTQAMIAVFAGAATAAYGTPAVSYYFDIIEPAAQNGLAFFIGLVSMNLIPGIIRVAEAFQRDPVGFIRRVLHWRNP